MAIKVWRRGDRYDVLVMSEAGRGPRYRSAEPLTALEVLRVSARSAATPRMWGRPCPRRTRGGWLG
jgi:hypothetical protein